MNFEDVHPHWIVFAVEDGSFYYEIGEEKGTASFGDLVFCPPGTTFRRVVVSPITLYVVFLRWRDDANNEMAPHALSAIPAGKVSIRDTGRLTQNYRLMQEAGTMDTRWARLKHNHYMHNIWLLYCDENENGGVMPEPTDPPRHVDPIAREAAFTIQKLAFQPFRLEEVADSLHISLTQLSKIFRKAFGMTPKHYLTSLRMEKARTLLLETNLTLDQISECCGYQNGFYLNRVFTKQMSLTPIEFRKTHRV
jgi:AraC-like DNA-binding protein